MAFRVERRKKGIWSKKKEPHIREIHVGILGKCHSKND